MVGTVLSLLILLQSASQPVAKDDIRENLARSQALYFEARFSDSVHVLTQVIEDLQSRPDRLADKVNARLQLALANIGLNENEKAKAYLLEMYTLDPNTALDPQQFSPKVIALATEAKATLVKIRCQAIGDDARTNLKEGNAAAIRRLIGSPDSQCVDMAAMGSEAADLLYRTGLDAYKNLDFANAVQNFQAALKFFPKHELASGYNDLAQGRLQVAEERTLIEWQKAFDSHKLKDAAVAYRQIVAFNDSRGSQLARQPLEQYRKTLTGLVETWNQTCPGGDEAAMNAIRGEISELLPDPAFGADIRSQMMPCDKPAVKPVIQAEVRQEAKLEPKPEIKPVVRVEPKPDKPAARNVPAATTSPKTSPVTNQCLALDYRVAMTRLKTRVEPDIPREARSYIQNSSMTVRVRVRIDENGNVVSSDTPGGNPLFNTAVKAAVDRWKFSSAMDASGTRCVDTEIPIVVGPLSTR